MPWEDATVGGFSLARVLSEPARRRLDAPRRRPVAAGALRAGVGGGQGHRHDARADRRRLVTCFVAPDDSAGMRARAAALPVRLGRSGVVEVVMPELSGRERVRLENAMLL